MGWAADHTARVFRVCTNTILNWENNADTQVKTVGSTVRPTPPVRRFADVVTNTVQLIAALDFENGETAALVLARAGWKVSARSVGRIAKGSRPKPTRPPSRDHRATHPVIARFVHHVWMVDVTEVQASLGGTLHVAGVFDAFSRVPLVLQTFERKPGASAMARLLEKAVRAFGKAEYVITDQGGEFDGLFRKTVARLGIIQRFGTVGHIFATARLERFWRTLKETANLNDDRPLTVEDLERRLERTLTYYLCFRPHQGLNGATPAEAFVGVPSPEIVASPPRGRRGEGPSESPFTIAFVDIGNGSFPILKKTA